jgi:hypothetical protein
LARRTVRSRGGGRSEGSPPLGSEELAARVIVLDDGPATPSAEDKSPHHWLYRRMALTDILGMVAALQLAA